jgi:hypothetical protein
MDSRPKRRAPTFYDYATTDWFRQPRAKGRSTVAGADVDAPCTGQYAVHAVHAFDRFVGVVAADLPVSVLERRLTRQLGGKDVEPWTVVTPTIGSWAARERVRREGLTPASVRRGM